MKLLRYGQPGTEKVGLLDGDEKIRDLSAVVDDLNPEVLANRLPELEALDSSALPLVQGKQRFGMPISGCNKFVCVGLNYIDHAREAGLPVPEQPVLFLKATTSMQGPDDDVILPRNYSKADWEVELGIVIGKRGNYITTADASSHIAGYCVINDLSERHFQLESEGQWTKGKSFDHFGPIGPYLVTPASAGNINALNIWLEVDGETMQSSNTSNMIFKVDELVSYISQYMTLLPGDIISTGTPHGVGLGMKPPRWLQAGETLRLGIEGLGIQTQRVLPPV